MIRGVAAAFLMPRPTTTTQNMMSDPSVKASPVTVPPPMYIFNGNSMNPVLPQLRPQVLQAEDRYAPNFHILSDAEAIFSEFTTGGDWCNDNIDQLPARPIELYHTRGASLPTTMPSVELVDSPVVSSPSRQPLPCDHRNEDISTGTQRSQQTPGADGDSQSNDDDIDFIALMREWTRPTLQPSGDQHLSGQSALDEEAQFRPYDPSNYTQQPPTHDPTFDRFSTPTSVPSFQQVTNLQEGLQHDKVQFVKDSSQPVYPNFDEKPTSVPTSDGSAAGGDDDQMQHKPYPSDNIGDVDEAQTWTTITPANYTTTNIATPKTKHRRYGADVRDRPPMNAQPPPGMDLTIPEVCTFLPNAFQVPEMAVRAMSAGWTATDIAMLQLHATNSLTEESLKAGRARIQKQLGEAGKLYCRLKFDAQGNKLTWKWKASRDLAGTHSSNDRSSGAWTFPDFYRPTPASRAAASKMAFKHVKLSELTLPVQGGNWPQGPDRMVMTECLYFSSRNAHLDLGTADFQQIMQDENIHPLPSLTMQDDVDARKRFRKMMKGQ